MGLAVALGWHESAIPVAAIRFQVLAPGAEDVARGYLAGQGVDLSGYRAVVSFEANTDAQNFVERNTDLATLGRLADGTLHIWSWRVRFFRELQKEEFAVNVLPNGAIAGYQHLLPEEAPGGELDEATALALAGPYLARERGIDLSQLGLVDRSTVRRDWRTDHYFSWERQGFRLAGGTDRYTVAVQGDRLDGFGQYFKVPEAWVRAQRLEFNRGVVLAQTGWAIVYILALAIGAAFLYFLPRRALRWRLAAWATGFLVVSGLIAAVNALPLTIAAYPTTQALPDYLSAQLVQTLAGLLPEALAVLLAGASGAALYRRVYPHLAPPGAILSARGLRSRELLTAIVLAYAFAGLWFGYISLFYATGTRFGVWSPVILPYRDVMSTFFPLAFPLTIGAGAAITEEFVFRLFAVPLLLFLWRSLQARRPALRAPWPGRAGVAAAIVLPAVAWGSLHASWPQQPFFIRAFEITLVGIAAGFVLGRYGIWATLLTHYIGNAAVVGALFFQSGRADLTFWGLVGIVWPALFALPGLIWRLRGHPLYPSAALAEPEGGVPVGSGSGAPAAAVENAPIAAVPTAGARIAAAKLLAWPALALAAALAFSVLAVLSPSLRGAALQVAFPGRQAPERVADYARGTGFDASGWIAATSFVDWGNGTAMTYLMRHLGVAAAERTLQQKVGLYFWQVRFLRSEARETELVRLDPQGDVRNFDHVLEEAAPGPRLDQDAARALAERYGADRQGVDWSRFRLVTAISNRLDNRTDHTFEWEEIGTAIDEGKFRLAMVIRGDRVARFLPFFKTPEAFDRALAGRTPVQIVLTSLAGVINLAFAGALLVYTVRLARAGRLAVRPAVLAGLAGALLLLLQRLNEWPEALSAYPSTYSVIGYAISQADAAVQAAVIRFAVLFLLVAAGGALWSAERGGVPAVAGRSAEWGTLRAPRSALRTPAWLALGALAFPWATLAAALPVWLLDTWFRGDLRAQSVATVGLLSAYLPALSAFARSLPAAAETVLAIGMGLLLLRRWLRRGRLALALTAVATGLLAAQNASSLPEALALALPTALAVGFSVPLLRRLLTHPLGYVLAVGTPALLTAAVFLLSQPDVFFRANGLLILAGLFTPGLGALLWWRRGQRAASRAPLASA
jgi:hypothetical protein